MANKFTISTKFKAHDSMTKTFKRMNKSMAGFSRTLKLVKTAVAGGIIFKAGKSFIDAASQVQQYQKTLEVMLGSQTAAAKRFEELSRFSDVTPFDLPQVIEFGNQLQAVGRYSQQNMTMLGDLAAAAGKPLEQVTGAFAKLATGQKGMAVDMFRDLLISTDDWIKATGKGITKSGQLVATTKEMIAALPKILKSKGFFGMMAEQSKTFKGAMSNLRGMFFRMKSTLGEALLEPLGKIANVISELVGKIVAWVKVNRDLIKQKVQRVFEAISRGATIGWRILRKLYGVFKKVWEFTSKLAGAFGGSFLEAAKGLGDPLSGIVGSLDRMFGFMGKVEGGALNLKKAFSSLGLIIGGALVASMQMLNALFSEYVYMTAISAARGEMRQARALGDWITVAEKKVEIAGLKEQRRLSRTQQATAFRDYQREWRSRYENQLLGKSPGASGSWAPFTGTGATGEWAATGRGASGSWGENKLTVDVEISKLPEGLEARARIKGKAPVCDLPLGSAHARRSSGASGGW